MSTDEFEKELKRVERKRNALAWLAAIPILALACAVRSVIWFFVVALLAAGIAWLLGSDDPRLVAELWGWRAVKVACVWTLLLFWGNL